MAIARGTPEHQILYLLRPRLGGTEPADAAPGADAARGTPDTDREVQPSVTVDGTGKTVAAYAKSHLDSGSWWKATGLAVGVALVSYVIAYWLLLPACVRGGGSTCVSGETYAVSSELSLFAAIFVVALAVERLLAPFSRWLVPDAEDHKDERDQATTALANGTGSGEDLAGKQAKVDQDRERAAIIHWGVAISISFLIAAKANILLLATIKAEGSAAPEAWLDLLVTGLVLGAGTKPVHDLVAKLEKSKEAEQDPAETGGKK